MTIAEISDQMGVTPETLVQEVIAKHVTGGIPTSQHVALVGQYAEAAACEAIQVAAMARKYLDMLEREE